MNSQKTTTVTTGTSTISILGIVFIVLKLTGYINWSWLWVLSPFWIPTVIVIIALIAWLIITLIFKIR